MQSITFITDWNKDDYYLGALKGSIISTCKKLPLFVDISHQIALHQYQEAAFVLRNSYHHFPEKSIHIITVNNRNENPVPYIAAKFNNHYFISPDSGVINLLVQNEAYEAVLMEVPKNYKPTFPSLSYAPKAICHIINNDSIQGLGEPFTLKEIRYLRPQTEPNQITGSITHIDSYGNIITNITQKLFEEARKNRNFSILLKGKSHGIEKLHNGYNENVNELIAVINSAGLLEIAHMNYPAFKSLGLQVGDRIKISFT
jgi:S-adenosylmethionine hydrolase